jgi:hypothetical protein
MARTGTNVPVAKYRKSDNAYNENIREKLGITDISRTITNFITKRGSYNLKVCLKRNSDSFKTVKQSNPEDVPKWRREKNRSDLGKRHKSLNCDAAMDIELLVQQCFTLTGLKKNNYILKEYRKF